MRADLGKPEFIEELIADKILSYTVTNGCEEGDNVAGSLKKIQVTTQTGKQLTLIFKIIPENAPQWIIDGQIFRTENAMYRTLVPRLKGFACSQQFNYDPPTPKYFMGFNDDKDDYICLEDVRPLGFMMPDKSKSFTLAEMNLVLKELAKLHAVSYAMIVKQGEQIFDTGDMNYFQMKEHQDPPDQPDSPSFRSYIEKYYEEATKIMKKRNPEIGQRMESLIPDIWKIFERTSMNRNYFQTIIHFDLWVNNLLIKYEDREPVDVKFIDFQFVRRGNIFTDLQYLILTSTTPEFRKDHLLSVLNGYFDQFSSTLEGLKCPMPQFNRGYLIDQFYECFLPGFIHMTFAIPLQLGYTGSEADDDNGSGEDDIGNIIQRQYLKSPVALARLDALAMEMIQMKLI